LCKAYLIKGNYGLYTHLLRIQVYEHIYA